MPRALRAWVLGATALTASIALVATLLVSGAGSLGRAELGRCMANGSLRTVEQVDAFVQDLATPEFEGADVGASIELVDGRHLFVFADTLRSTPFGRRHFVRNSMIVVGDDCPRVVMPADHGAVIPDRDEVVGYWPMSLTRLGEGSGYELLGVSAQRVRSTGRESDGVFAFEIMGFSAAIFVVPRGGTPRLLNVQDFGPDLVDPTRPIWGAATAVADGWVYLYGTARPWAVPTAFSLQVARARPSDFLDQARWQYWNGWQWVADPDSAAPLIAADGGVSQTLSIFSDRGRWYAVSKRDEWLGTDLTIWTAPAPIGPFVATSVVAHIPSDPATGMMRYMPLAHPDLLPRSGSVVVSYSENNLRLGVILADPRLYRPRFIRVPLPS
jgi:hypothetical protein